MGSGTFETSWRTKVVVVPEGHEAARKRDLDAFTRAYRANPPRLTAEMRAEARAEFGPGVKMVDVISGRTWTT
jgi:hypothetical protein